MMKSLFVLSATLYWISFLLRLTLWTWQNPKLKLSTSIIEKAGLVLFTGGLVFYIGALQIVNGEVQSLNYDRPISFLLFAWAVCAAHTLSEVAYGNTMTAAFANLWTALTLTISSTAARAVKSIFTNDLQWLSFHRMCFLLGYAFCILAFPLVLRYFRISFRYKRAPKGKQAAMERELFMADRMSYRMVLWALPLLTAGIITEVLLLIEEHRLPSPEQLWPQQHESLLALTAWFLCGIYLHTRLFFGWRNFSSACLYLTGLLFLVGGHFSQLLMEYVQ